jgi:hypothetical protein
MTKSPVEYCFIKTQMQVLYRKGWHGLKWSMKLGVSIKKERKGFLIKAVRKI